MRNRIISEQELTAAAALVREAMLASLPELQDCGGQFSARFEEKIGQLKRSEERKARLRGFAKGVAAAMLVVLLGFTMLCAFQTEVRAAVVGWFKETFGSYTTYWFQSEQENALPEYELTWMPDGCQLVYDDSSESMRVMVYQRGEDPMDGFTFDFARANNNSLLFIESFGENYTVESVRVNEQPGDLYMSSTPQEANVLVWIDEENSVVFTITSYFDSVDMLHIAEGVKSVK